MWTEQEDRSVHRLTNALDGHVALWGSKPLETSSYATVLTSNEEAAVQAPLFFLNRHTSVVMEQESSSSSTYSTHTPLIFY